MWKPFVRTILLTGMMLLASGVCASLSGRQAYAQQTPGDLAVMQVEFITTRSAEPNQFDGLWKYLEHATLRGPSVELLARNGLFLGKLETRFRKEFDTTVGKLPISRRIPHMVQMIPGRSQEFSIGPETANRTLFVWKTSNSFVGRRYARARHGMALTAKPVSEQHCDVTIKPVVRHGTTLTKYMDIEGLTVRTSMEIGQSIILSPSAGKPTGLGAAFYWGAKNRGQSRTFIIVTLISIRKTETD